MHYPNQTKRYKWHDIDVVPIGGNNNKVFSHTVLGKRLNKAFQSVNECHSIDVIHSFWLNQTSIFAQNLSDKYAIPLIASAQGQDVLPANSYLKKLRKKTLLTSMSSFQQAFLINQNIQSKVILWGMKDVGKYKAEKERIYDLIGIGNLIELKQYAYFLKLCVELRKQNKDFKAVLVGDGPLRKKLQQFIDFNDLSNNVELAGIVERDGVFELLQKSRIFVHPARFEGFGMVLIEAANFGVHVLSGNVGCANDFNFIHQLTFDPKLDVQKIQELFCVEQKRYFVDIRDTVKQYVALYQSISQ